MTAVDARELNWRFVVPDDRGAVLLDAARARDFAGAASPLREALTGGPFGAVVLRDLSAWAVDLRPTAVVAAVAVAVAPGGWMCALVANRAFPAAWRRRDALRLRAVLSALRAAGLERASVHVALPDADRPAMLVDARPRSALDHVLRDMLLTYVPGGSASARLARRCLVMCRAVGARAPHALRVALAPGYCVVARRPE
jgi:SAM-dependent methyltransferase